MITIAQNPHYSLLYDFSKNRLYFKMSGYWRRPEEVPNYLQDWRKALKETKPNFTLLADVSDMVTHPAALRKLHEEAIALCQLAQVKQIAEVTPRDRIAVLQITAMAQEMKAKFNSFEDRRDAERWLNSEDVAV
ncbi:MAG: hypothetical protein LPK19_05220 [Hymenobacteraceae bacterium]|nr:hypothetical protein [Hymenobacteraceae bacterium]MDX5395600.1 hypothetical protein [Hymenobacteraceae bacterium]MDX5511652.1 hypothetical protein [Hymenobacteraceae bacterium]